MLKIIAVRQGKTDEETKISPVIAVALARVKISEGWNVEIIDERGNHYQAERFHELLSSFGK